MGLEQLKVLELLQRQIITVPEAADLLDALAMSEPATILVLVELATPPMVQPKSRDQFK